MKSRVFNTVFENMLRVLLLMDVLGYPGNSDRIAALDFICIFGRKCGVLDKNLHGDNDFGFSELTDKRSKVREAIGLAVKNDLVDAIATEQGFMYGINDRGRQVVENINSAYAKQYTVGAKIVCRRFEGCPEEKILQFITDRAAETKGV